MMDLSRLLDTHCHVGAYPDPVSVINKASSAGVSMVAVTETPEEYRRLRTRLGRREGVEVAIGLHPLRAHTISQNDLARFFRLVPEAKWIGEVGLDFSRHGVESKRRQLQIFDAVLTEAQPGRHPLTVHSRGAEEDTIRLLAAANLPAVMHWYSGPTSLIDRACDAGLYFSINIAMARSTKFAALVRAIPRERVLLETDGPYARAGGSVAHPHHVGDVITLLARAWGIDSGSATELVVGNQSRVLAQNQPSANPAGVAGPPRLDPVSDSPRTELDVLQHQRRRSRPPDR